MQNPVLSFVRSLADKYGGKIAELIAPKLGGLVLKGGEMLANRGVKIPENAVDLVLKGLAGAPEFAKNWAGDIAETIFSKAQPRENYYSFQNQALDYGGAQSRPWTNPHASPSGPVFRDVGSGTNIQGYAPGYGPPSGKIQTSFGKTRPTSPAGLMDDWHDIARTVETTEELLGMPEKPKASKKKMIRVEKSMVEAPAKKKRMAAAVEREVNMDKQIAKAVAAEKARLKAKKKAKKASKDKKKKKASK